MTIQAVIDQAFAAQKEAFLSGKTRDVDGRLANLRRFKQAILDNKQAIYQALDSDLGKTPEVVDMAEIGAVTEEIDVMLENLATWAQDDVFPLTGHFAGSEGRIRAEPYGLTYIIGPFNYPFNLTLTPLVGAIAAGNTAILKPSESTPATSAIIKKVIAESFDPEIVTVIEGGRKENEILLAKPFDFFFFTGSPNVGKIIMKAAADHLAPVVLELGGKCPVVVFEDADIDLLIERLTYTKYLNSGQTCVAPDYLLVPEAISQQVVDKLLAKIAADYQGKSVGKVVNAKQVEKLAGYLKETKGKVVAGGDYDEQHRQFAATVVTDVEWDDALMQDEIFGPILPILSYTDLASVREKIITHHEKPLAIYAFSQDEQAALDFITTIQSGDAQINDMLTHAMCPQLPFGGIGPSGMGKYHGKTSFDIYSHKRSIRTVKA